jgi:serine/threonine protein kinase/Tol biopolymer transport system component
MSPQSSIAHYRITGKLGEGGMGAVYRATDTKLNREVAIKVLPPAFAQDADRMARFARESQVLAALNHPNIAAIYGVEERALVMELVEGPTLAERIAQGPIPLPEALAAASQIADALEYAHENSIIHRDLKPANVKITPEGRVKVLDFGLAAVVHANEAVSASDPIHSPTLTISPTRAGMILGTAAYMSPEQARGSQADKRADIWAFGAVLYEMLTGRRAFPGETVTDILASVIKEQPDYTALPAQTRTAVERCLSKDRRKRWGSIDDVRWALDTGQATVSVTLPARKRARWLWPVIAGLALVAGASLGSIYWRPKPAVASVSFEIQPPAGQRIIWGSLSPDGRQAALLVTSPTEGRNVLMIRSMDDLALRSVPGVEPDSVVWSPDGRKIAFAQAGTIRTVDLSSGSITDVCSADSPRLNNWGGNGVILFTAAAGDSVKRQIFQVPARGGTAHPLFPLDAARQETRQEDAEFLPGGERIVYWSTAGKDPGTYAASLDGGVRKFLLAGRSAIYLEHPRTRKSSLVFAAYGEGVFLQEFDANALKLVGDPIQVPMLRRGYVEDAVPSALLFGKLPLDRNRLAWFSRTGKEEETIAETDTYRAYDLSPDNRHLVLEVLTEPNGFGDLWVKELDRGTRLRLTSDPGWEYGPHFWPDGSKVAFVWYRGSPYRFNLAIKPSNGSGSEELVLETHGRIFLNDVSPDEKYLLYSQDGPPSTLWVLPLEGDRRPILYRGGKGDNESGRFSRDGRWIAYVSTDSGRNEIHVQDFQPAPAEGLTRGDLTVVSTGGGVVPSWSADGKELFYLSPDNSLMSTPVKTAGQFSSGKPEKLFRMTLGARLPYVPSADGRRFLIAVPESSKPRSSATLMVTNWMEALIK